MSRIEDKYNDNREAPLYKATVIKQGRIYAGNRTVGNAVELAREFNEMEDKKRYIEQFSQRYNSYMGYLIHRSSYGIRWQIWRLVGDETRQYVYMAGKMAVMKVREQYKEINKLKMIYRHGKRHDANRRVA